MWTQTVTKPDMHMRRRLLNLSFAICLAAPAISAQCQGKTALRAYVLLKDGQWTRAYAQYVWLPNGRLRIYSGNPAGEHGETKEWTARRGLRTITPLEHWLGGTIQKKDEALVSPDGAHVLWYGQEDTETCASLRSIHRIHVPAMGSAVECWLPDSRGWVEIPYRAVFRGRKMAMAVKWFPAQTGASRTVLVDTAADPAEILDDFFTAVSPDLLLFTHVNGRNLEIRQVRPGRSTWESSRRINVRLPDAATVIDRDYDAPRGQIALLLAKTEGSAAGHSKGLPQDALHRPTKVRLVLWIGRLTAHGVRHEGTFAIRLPGTQSVPHPDPSDVEEFQWLPGGRSISFLIGDSLLRADLPHPLLKDKKWNRIRNT